MCRDGVEVVARSALPTASEVTEKTLTSILENNTNSKYEVTSRSEDIFIFQGNILSMAGGYFNPIEAFATRGDTIIATGTVEEVKLTVGDEVKVVSLGDRYILPGFVDPHIHLLMTALVANADHIVDFSYPNVKTREDALELVKKSTQHRKEGLWISGYGYDPSLVKDHPDLRLDMIDEVTGEGHPVIIINQSGHVAYINTAGFQAANIGLNPGDTGYPANDANFRKDDEGKVTGILLEEAVTQMSPYLPKLQAPEVVSGAHHVLKTWASRGITTVFDCGIGHLDGLPDLNLIREATSNENIPSFRGAIAIQAIEHLIPILDILSPPPWKLDNFQVYGIKFWLDGSTQGFTAALNKPYLDQTDGCKPNFGILNYRKSHDLDSPPDDDKLFSTVRPFISRGWQIVMHTNGARALDQALRVYARLFAAEPTAARQHMHRLEHVTADISPAQLKRAAQLGLGVSHLIAHVRKWGRTFEEWVLGPERAARLDPVKDGVDAGVVYSFHSDSPISVADPLQYVETAMTRVMNETGTPLGIDQGVSVEEAFRGITYNPARQIGALEEVGSIEVGKKADFVVLDRDPRGVHGKVRAELNVLETWIRGKLAYRHDNATQIS